MKILLLLLIIPGWILFHLSKLSKRSSNTIAFGVHTQSFSGNVKALFLRQDCGYIKIFISTDRILVRKLKKEGHSAYTKFSPSGLYYALHAGTYIYSGFPSDINYWLSGGVKYINVWHGTPLKKIERDVSTGHYSKRNKYEWLFKLIAPYLLVKPDVLLVSSAYEEKCLKSAFDVEEDMLVRSFPPRLEALVSHRETRGTGTTILYVPTWRDDHSFSFEDCVDLGSFNHFLVKNRINFSIKQHPSNKSRELNGGYSNINTIPKGEDIYSFLESFDLLVSDYSSMIFECFYLSKPVLLFCPDYKSYQTNSREFYIDPCKDLPVGISFTQNELERNILSSLKESSTDLEKIDVFRPYPIRQQLLSLMVEK